MSKIQFSSTFIMGINLTYFAFLFGKIFGMENEVSSLRTFQAIATNVCFDFFTVYVTYKLLKWSLGNTERKAILFKIICIDIIFASIFCIASLFFALLGTDSQLSLLECSNVFLGYSKDGSRINLGAQFWFMHSSFIPTLGYLTLVLIAWFSKILLIPFKLFFGAAAVNEKPVSLTAALIAIFIVFFGSMSFMAGEFADKAKEGIANRSALAARSNLINHNKTKVGQEMPLNLDEAQRIK
ncbi:MAG: hypothetical protein AABY93_08385 [Bacteroidota bacterium]